MDTCQVCMFCKHYDRQATPGTHRCAAFPDGIPKEIWRQRFDHRQPHPGDHGIQFEPKSPEAAAYVKEYYKPKPLRLPPGVELTPLVQAVASLRRPDGGAAANAGDTGYSRLLAAPGLELRVKRLRVFADIEAPLWQNVRGNQLVAPWQAKLTVSLHL